MLNFKRGFFSSGFSPLFGFGRNTAPCQFGGRFGFNRVSVVSFEHGAKFNGGGQG